MIENSTQQNKRRWHMMWLMLVGLFFSSPLFSQSVTCNSLVHISLDGNCQAVVGADQILEGTYSNLNNYTVTFTNTGLPVILGAGNVGQTYSVTVTSPTGNTCWSNILVEDKTPPTITCQDVILSCTDPLPTQPTSAFDACGSVTVTHQDVVQDNGCSGTFSKIITRTYTATDGSGNTSNCVQTISIQRASLASVTVPADVTIDCQGNSTPSSTGFPSGTDCFNLDYTHEDVIVPICEGSHKILRKWTLTDWCTNTILTETQIIKVLDTTGPTFQPLQNMTVSATSNSCAANVGLPTAILSDDCSGGSFDVRIETPLGTILGNGGVLLGAPLGNHTITYFATDACGSESSFSFTLTVIDLIAPIAICDEHTIVGIGSTGTAQVEAITFDDGSTDNCGIATYKARRMDNPNCPGNDATAFDDYVPFSCCDVNTTVMVELQITDDAGNTNSCMVEVEVQDKVDPTIVCPSDKTISCEDDYEDLSLTGEAVATDNCGSASVTHLDISTNIGCGGVGTVLRLWTATDAQGRTASCIQTITIENDEPFYINPNNQNDPTDDIDWPIDYTTNTCGAGLEPHQLPTPYNRPVIYEDGCDFIAESHEDTYLPIQEPACVKILRKWIIVDWCQAGQNADPTQPGPGVWHYTQVIKVMNSTPPVISDCDVPTVVGNFEADCGATFAEFNIAATDDCTAEEDLEYSWTFSNGLSGNGKTAFGNFFNGTYTLTFTVEDGCGNASTCVKDFIVEDKKKPTPICILGLSTVVMPSSGEVTIEASAFESGSSYDNCSAYDDLKISFSANVNDTELTISCLDIIGNAFYPVEIWVTDENGNQDFCSTLIKVDDPHTTCGIPALATIAGDIKTEYQEEVENVTVQLSGGNLPPVVTGTTGGFNFPQLTMGANYTVTPEKDIDYLNGVTTMDLVKISRHILGVEILDSPYKVIAADVNKSKSITGLDMVKIRSLILMHDLEFTNNTSWRFVGANHEFSNPVNPWLYPFPEAVDFANLTTTEQANFVGVKIGDVNGSATPNSLLGTDTRNFEGTLNFVLENKKVATGETFDVEFKAKDFKVAGYQFALEFEGLEFVDLKTNLENLSKENFGYTLLQENVLTTSWNVANDLEVADDEVLFTLTFKAQQATQVSNALKISNRYIAAEAYQGNELHQVALSVKGGTVNASAFVLYQNTPNPFKDETTIGFSLPEATKVNLKIYDATGRVLKLVNGDFAKGYHEVNISKTELSGAGILYYQLYTNEHTATKKMILVE